jgi:hypothetical protein
MTFIFLLLMGSAPAESVSIDVHAGGEQLVVSSPDGHLHLDEVTLGEKSTLVVPDVKSLHIRRLIAKDGAKIRLLSVLDGADAPSPGHNGGNARIFLKEISGHVLIEARGGDGANGKYGRDGRQGREGADGRHARTLFFGLIYLGDGEDGGIGEAGQDGEDGGDGGDGGAGGHATVYYKSKADQAAIVVDIDGGKAGRGGTPGVGGLGGNGGAGGQGIEDGAQGALGKSGRAGIPGRPGRPGTPGEAQILQLDGEIFDCLSKLDARAIFEHLDESDYEVCRQTKPVELRTDLRILSAENFQSVQPILRDDGVFLLNADGKDGEDAPFARSLGSTPPDGTSGSRGGHFTIVLRDLPSKAVISARGGKGGRGGDGVNGARGIDGFDGRSANAFRKSTPGVDGQDGGRGGNGSDGGAGGAGGFVRIVYIHENLRDSNWRGIFEIMAQGGDGGAAGRGAAGGRAGAGGKGGATMIKGKKRADGRDGRAGEKGQDGRGGFRGDDGIVEFVEAVSYQAWIVDDFKIQTELYFGPTN